MLYRPWDDAHPPWASVERAVEAGELCGKPVMVDFWPRPPERPYPDLEDAAKTHAVCFAADLSAESGRPVAISEIYRGL